MNPIQQSTVTLSQRIRAASETDAVRILQDHTDECKCQGQLHFRQLSELTAQRDILAASGQELKKDKERLDLVEYGLKSCHFDWTSKGWSIEHGNRIFYANTLRAAIDAAISAKE